MNKQPPPLFEQSPSEPLHENRRRGPDFWVKVLPWFVGFSWLMAIVSTFVVDRAGPNMLTMPGQIERQTRVSTAAADQPIFWDLVLVRVSEGLLTATFILCVLALVVNMLRSKRKEDRIKRAPFVVGAITLILYAILFVCT